jgi:arginase family enzyme
LAERLTILRSTPGLAGVEIVEFNPHLDHSGKTAHLAGQLLAAILPE